MWEGAFEYLKFLYYSEDAAQCGNNGTLMTIFLTLSLRYFWERAGKWKDVQFHLFTILYIAGSHHARYAMTRGGIKRGFNMLADFQRHSQMLGFKS